MVPARTDTIVGSQRRRASTDCPTACRVVRRPTRSLWARTVPASATSSGKVSDAKIQNLKRDGGRCRRGRPLIRRGRSRNPLDGLTVPEHQVLALMAEGRTNSAISECLYLSPKTVEASSPGSISTRAPTTTAGSSPSSRSCGAVRLFSRVGRCSGPGRAARR
jgi:hypothetical protein